MMRPSEQSTAIARCLSLLLVLILLSPAAGAQKSKRKNVSAVKPPSTTLEQKPEPISEEERKRLDESASESREKLIAASQTYRESLEKLLVLQKQDDTRLVEKVEKQKHLLDLGVIARRELEESEHELTASRVKLAETEKQIEEVDLLVAEVNAAEELAKTAAEQRGSYISHGLLVRYVGSSRWALSDLAKVEAFFRLKFSKPLPVSAIGQSETHNRLGFDHREAIDVAVHPDSEEGRELVNYLASQGISFFAIRGAIAGSATGAHIHIGPPSKRIAAQ
jgi:hypothetical protein